MRYLMWPVVAFLVLVSIPVSAAQAGLCYKLTNVSQSRAVALRAAPTRNGRLVELIKRSEKREISRAGKCRRGWCNVSVSGEAGRKKGWLKARLLRPKHCP